MQSANGVYLDNTRLEPGKLYALKDGNEINIGNIVVLRFEDPFMTVPRSKTVSMLPRGLMLGVDNQDVYVQRQILEPALSTRQFRFLQVLYENEGRIVSREEVASFAWPEYADIDAEDAVSEAMIDSTVYRIRKRLRDLDEHEYIEVVRDAGFRFIQRED